MRESQWFEEKKEESEGEKENERSKYDLYLTSKKSKPAVTRKFWMGDFEQKEEIQFEILRKDVKSERISPYVNVGK